METYGNTASREALSPVVSTQEEPSDMSVVRQVFERASKAIVDASNLTQTVADLQQSVDHLKSELENYRRNNTQLDETLQHIRGQRDTALDRARTAESERDEARRDLNTVKADNLVLSTGKADLSAMLATARKERDDAIMKGLEQEVELAETKAKLSELKASVEKVFEPVGFVPKPEPMPHDPKLEEIKQGAPYGVNEAPKLVEASPQPNTEPELGKVAPYSHYNW